MKFAEKFAFFKVFTSHMVLQRDRKITLSGTASRGKTVCVKFDGTAKTAKAGKNGEWSVSFPALPAGGPHRITLSGAEGVPPVVLDDVLMGEVWLCSGQSNMAMPIWSVTPFWYAANGQEVLKHADIPNLRIFNGTKGQKPSPYKPRKEPFGNGWKVCNAKDLMDFSACGFFFGQQLLKDLKIPVGLINCAWSGTNIESWISKKGLRACSVNQFENMPEYDPSGFGKLWKEQVLPNRKLHEWVEDFNKLGKTDPAFYTDFFDDSAWLPSAKYRDMQQPGRMVLRVHFTVPEEFTKKDSVLSFGPCSDTVKTYLNSRKIGETTVDVPAYYAILQNYTVPAGTLRAGDNVLVIECDNHFGYGFIQLDSLKFSVKSKDFEPDCTCRYKVIFQMPEGFPQRPDVPVVPWSPELDANYPTALYNAMLAPWFRYGIRGTIWYQGCNNNGQFGYFEQHKKLIEEFRENWNDSKMPFLIVQLSAFHFHTPDKRLDDKTVDALPVPEYSPYGITREIQAEMPKVLRNVGLVVSFDKGDHSDIHPHDKQVIGERLAKRAENMVYGAEKTGKSPEFRGLTVHAGELRIAFNHAESGLVTTDGEAPKGFCYSDRNGTFFKASDVSIDGNEIVIHYPLATQVERVRYAFTSFCRVNLTNREGLPVIPFRTDKPDYEKMFRK